MSHLFEWKWSQKEQGCNFVRMASGKLHTDKGAHRFTKDVTGWQMEGFLEGNLEAKTNKIHKKFTMNTKRSSAASS